MADGVMAEELRPPRYRTIAPKISGLLAEAMRLPGQRPLPGFHLDHPAATQGCRSASQGLSLTFNAEFNLTEHRRNPSMSTDGVDNCSDGTAPTPSRGWVTCPQILMVEDLHPPSHPEAGIVQVKTIGYNQEGTVVISFLRTVMVFRRVHGPTPPPAPRDSA